MEEIKSSVRALGLLAVLVAALGVVFVGTNAQKKRVTEDQAAKQMLRVGDTAGIGTTPLPTVKSLDEARQFAAVKVITEAQMEKVVMLPAGTLLLADPPDREGFVRIHVKSGTYSGSDLWTSKSVLDEHTVTTQQTKK
jgi:hypothetical protein